ncbi:hypothetical protein HYW32_04245 [Candidatus Berkelbacteria bacterium]|nr:hypothetical protein [Candidatus Berkelbacteria bacterium]
MDLDLYVTLLRRHLTLYLGVFCLTFLSIVLLSFNQKPRFEGSLFLSVAQAPQSAPTSADFYEYGEFYSLQGSGFLSDYLASWLKDPATVNTILVEARASSANQTIRSLSRMLEIKSQGRLGLQVMLNRLDEQEVNRILTAIKSVVTARLETLQSQGFYKDFSLITGDVLVTKNSQSLPFALGLGLTSGIFITIFIFLITASVAPVKQQLT